MRDISLLISSLENHSKNFPDEKIHTQSMIEFLIKNNEKAFDTYHWDDGHITASILIINPEKTKVLLIFHKKLQKWLQFGGHSDGSFDVLQTAIREFHEESGIVEEPEIFSYSNSDILPIFDIDIHNIPSDIKGKPRHKHYDIRFLGIISDTVDFSYQVHEVDDMRWFPIDDVEKYIEEDGLIRMIKKVKCLPGKPSIL